MASKPEQKESLAPSVFSGEIEGFTAKSKLSRRETDIVHALVKNITNSEEIAKALGISTHTVNNHLKSIFEKTQTKSKTEILSCFLRFAADKLQNRSLFVRKPRVLVIDDEQMICEFIATGLHDRGMRTYTLTDPAQAVELISKFNIDFVVCDVRMPVLSGMDVLAKVRKSYPCWPHFVFITGHPDYTLEECMHAGAVGFVEKPLDIDQLFRMIMVHLVESGEERNELLKINGTTAVSITENLSLQDLDFGYGGAFLPLDANSQKKHKVGVGSIVEVNLSAASNPGNFKVRGQVVWKRPASENDCRVGIGLKFIEMNERDQHRFDDFLKTHDVKSYIPIGRG